MTNSLAKPRMAALLLLCCLLAFAPSCKSGKKVQGKRYTPVLQPPSEAQTPVRKAPKPGQQPARKNGEIKVRVPDAKTEIEVVEKQQPLRKAIAVSVMLPFSLDKYQPDMRNDSMPSKTMMALELYEGIQVALEELSNEGMSLDVKVYDTQNDPGHVGSLLSNDQHLKASDIIIGPVYNRPLAPVAAFAKRNGIYHISPLSPSNSITIDNPYYMAASPSIETHLYAIYRHIKDGAGKKRIITLCGNSANELKLAQLFPQFSGLELEAGNEGMVDVYQLVYNGQPEMEIEAYLSPDEENVFVVTSFNELFINEIIPQIHMLKDKYRITLFGMPKWMEMETLQLDYLPDLNFHITLPVWMDGASPAGERFKNAFFQRFYVRPNANAAAGYDLTRYFLKMYERYGNELPQHFGDPSISGVFNNYHFQPATATQYQSKIGKLDYYENKYVNILKYDRTFSLVKVN